jgi:hypothetical protein
LRPLRTDFFRYLAEVYQSKRRKNILSLLLLIALVSGFFDTLGMPLLSSISFVSACAMIAYIGYILLTFVPSGWEQRPR